MPLGKWFKKMAYLVKDSRSTCTVYDLLIISSVTTRHPVLTSVRVSADCTIRDLGFITTSLPPREGRYSVLVLPYVSCTCVLPSASRLWRCLQHRRRRRLRWRQVAWAARSNAAVRGRWSTSRRSCSPSVRWRGGLRHRSQASEAG